VTDLSFGGSSTGLLHRLRPTRIAVHDVRDVAERLLPTVSVPGLRVDLVQRLGAGSVLVLEEDERVVRVDLAELADDMTRAGVAPTPTGIATALAAWVVRRPVTDVQASRAGIAVLHWADRRQTAIGWRVLVRRGDLALPWTPSPSCGRADVELTRAAATARSHDVVLDLRVEGPVALWSHADVPVLATAALVEPERMVAAVTAAGLSIPDLHVVVTPERPVACAGRGVAARLAGETSESSVTLPWQSVATLPWI
jgi:hypothetical protein